MIFSQLYTEGEAPSSGLLGLWWGKRGHQLGWGWVGTRSSPEEGAGWVKSLWLTVQDMLASAAAVSQVRAARSRGDHCHVGGKGCCVLVFSFSHEGRFQPGDPSWQRVWHPRAQRAVEKLA